MTDQETEEVMIMLGMLVLFFFSTILIVTIMGAYNGKQDNQPVQKTAIVSQEK